LPWLGDHVDEGGAKLKPLGLDRVGEPGEVLDQLDEDHRFDPLGGSVLAP